MTDHSSIKADKLPQLVRLALAAESGLDERLLNGAERQEADSFMAAGFLRRTASGRIVANRLHPSVKACAALLPAMRPEATEMFGAAETAEELDHRTATVLFTFLDRLTMAVTRSASIDELLRSAFRQLASTVTFDSAAGVMFEETIELHIVRREGASATSDRDLVERIRELLKTEVTDAFSTAEIVVRGDYSDLPRRNHAGSVLRFSAHSSVRFDGRTAGLLVFFREEGAFTIEEQQVLDIFAIQVAIVLAKIVAQERIQSLAETDDLTGVRNKRSFRQRLNEEIERARSFTLPLSLMALDVDRFKSINDTFGHPVGDVVLSEFCGAVKENLRSADLLARIGGDEFTIILPHTNMQQAIGVAERILRCVERLEIASLPISCTVSIGIATLLDVHATPDELIRAADERLYDAKNRGRNRCSY
jgi:diguanylate cyclase (GGDEF)-like protein